MPSLNFEPQFVPAVESGEKRQTIRARRKRAWLVGDTLHLFAGQRLSTCRKLGEATLLSVRAITIDTEERCIYLEGSLSDTGRGSGMFMQSDAEALRLAKDDGFASLDDFFDFFEARHSSCFHGHLLKW